MLQPDQLKDVARHYGQAVSELRAFFASANLLVEREHSLTEVLLRLQEERAFRRDLVSHMLVVLHESPVPVSYADQLAILALAAAGPVHAAAAQEEDAHALLLFLMDGKTGPGQKPAIPVRPPEARPAPVQGNPSRGNAPVDPPARTDLRHIAARGWNQEEPRRKTNALLVGSALCLAATAVGVFLMHDRIPVPFGPSNFLSSRRTEPVTATSSTSEASDSEAINGPRTRNQSPMQDLQGMDGNRNAPARAAALPGSTVVATAHWPAVFASEAVPAAAPTRSSPRAPQERSVVTPEVSPRPTQRVPQATRAPEAAPARVSPGTPQGRSVVTPEASPRPTQLVPQATRASEAASSAVLSQRLGARSLPADSHANDAMYYPQYPRLVRRHPSASAADTSEEGARNVAANELPSPSPVGRNVAPSSASTVRPVSLGIMAANVLYSPAPVYPAAAAAARVQGEVKVQAEVDRDGNVASARVISGPPLLRDAVMDAIQHWRYRPYFAGGKPVAMSALAVVDFQLQ